MCQCERNVCAVVLAMTAAYSLSPPDCPPADSDARFKMHVQGYIAVAVQQFASLLGFDA